MTLAMFTLVVFTLVVGATTSGSFVHAFDDLKSSAAASTCARHVAGDADRDMRAALARTPGLNPPTSGVVSSQSRCR